MILPTGTTHLSCKKTVFNSPYKVVRQPNDYEVKDRVFFWCAYQNKWVASHLTAKRLDLVPLQDYKLVKVDVAIRHLARLANEAIGKNSETIPFAENPEAWEEMERYNRYDVLKEPVFKLSKAEFAFKDWFLSLPDADETLVSDMDNIESETVQAMWIGFQAGYSEFS